MTNHRPSIMRIRVLYSLALVVGTRLIGACSATSSTPAPAPQPVTTPPAAANRSPAPDTSRPAGAPAPQQGGAPGAAAPGADPVPRPYDRVITSQAKTRNGLMKTHRIGSRLYFEVPASLLGKDLLVVPRMARAFEGLQGGTQIDPETVVRWERHDNRAVLRNVSYGMVADPSTPMARAVENSNYGTVVSTFNVEAYGPDSAMVVDVTRLFTAPPNEIGTSQAVRGAPDPARSFIERAVAYPTNVEVEATLTFNPTPAPPTPGPVPNPSFGVGNPPSSQSMVMHWSIVKLPDSPMRPRLADSRVGYFAVQQVDYGRPEQSAKARTYIARYRLDKKDPNAALSDPVRPIVYYVDPATPRWLIPWVKKGIEAWQPAYEAAGFRNAIVARDTPSPEEDPDWSPEDARYSVVRWFATDIENSVGPAVVDPRSGEIIEADVYMFHNIMQLLRTWYFTQVGHLDARALQFPFPDSLMGQLVQSVVTHEVGHTLGFPHNQKASANYPVDSVRSRTWVHRMGHSPSIMDYSRFNYTAQPEDRIDVADLGPRVGPYDIFAVMWGHKPIPGASTPDAEVATLNQWARMQDSIPWYRFNVVGSNGSDPGDQSEAVGDADAVKATGWGITSLKRTVPLIMKAATHEGDDYSDLDLVFTRTIDQWRRELGHVANIVGGTSAVEKHAGQAGVRFIPTSKNKQQEAVRFLNDNAFATPSYFLDREIMRRIEVDGALRRINQVQTNILATLFNDRRMERLMEQAAFDDPGRAYALADMLSDVRGGIWKELDAPTVTIDAYRRGLQRAYLQFANTKLNPAPFTPPPGVPPQFLPLIGPARLTSDVRALFRAELRSLDDAISAALPKAQDRSTRAHLEDARAQIRTFLDPRR